MTWAKRQMRSLTENLGDLAGHDIILASQRPRHPDERLLPRRRHGWSEMVTHWPRTILGTILSGKDRNTSVR